MSTSLLPSSRQAAPLSRAKTAVLQAVSDVSLDLHAGDELLDEQRYATADVVGPLRCCARAIGIVGWTTAARLVRAQHPRAVIIGISAV